MIRKYTKTKILDKLHRFGVITCIALTGYGISLTTYQVYYYLTVRKPELARQRAELEKKLLSEGQAKLDS